MYRESEESFNLVKDIVRRAVPKDISIKKRKEGGVALVIGENQHLYFLNEIASEFLFRCEGTKTTDEICQNIINLYDVDTDILLDDMIVLIRDLQKKRIIRIDCIL